MDDSSEEAKVESCRKGNARGEGHVASGLV